MELLSTSQEPDFSWAPSPLTQTTVWWQAFSVVTMRLKSMRWPHSLLLWVGEAVLILSPGLWGMAHGLFLITLSLGPLCFHSPPPNPLSLYSPQTLGQPLVTWKHFKKSFNGFIWENTKWCLCALKISPSSRPCFEVIVPLGKEGRNSSRHLRIYWQSKNIRIYLY